jgi:pSer/pThr/pTyr-binding forkhead associated (FHA) protein
MVILPMSDQDEHNEHSDDETMARRPDTAILSSGAMQDRGDARISRGAITFGDQYEIILVIRGIVERLILPESRSVVMGRADSRARSQPDVDLTSYGALDRGVSREHCRFHVENGYIYVTDLGSTNGTFLAGKRLEPHEPAILHKGDELLLSRLPIQVLFR